MAKISDLFAAVFRCETTPAFRTRILIEHLRCLTAHPAVTRQYEMMSGGFLWSDERPSKEYQDSETGYAMRLLLGYRASLTRGRPREEFRPVWDAVLKGCPQWPGFLPERRSSELAEELERSSKRSLRQLETLDRAISRHHDNKTP